MTNDDVAQQASMLAITAAACSTLSFLGSVTLVYLILWVQRSKDPKLTTFHRLMLGLSFSDIIHSIWFGLGPIPNIEGYSIGAFGNQATCTAQGFFMTLGQASIYYNFSIMIYFLLVIRYRWRPEQFVNLERIMHSFSVLFPAISGVFLVATGYMNPSPYQWGRCFIVAFPPECEETNTCTRGIHAATVKLVLLAIPTTIVFFLLFAITLAIPWTVRQQSLRMARRYSFNRSQKTVPQAVIRQSILYGVFFFLTYFWTLFILGTSIVRTQQPVKINLFPIRILREMFYPLQGFFNCWIYLHGNHGAAIQERISKIARDASGIFFGKNSGSSTLFCSKDNGSSGRQEEEASDTSSCQEAESSPGRRDANISNAEENGVSLVFFTGEFDCDDSDFESDGGESVIDA